MILLVINKFVVNMLFRGFAADSCCILYESPQFTYEEKMTGNKRN